MFGVLIDICSTRVTVASVVQLFIAAKKLILPHQILLRIQQREEYRQLQVDAVGRTPKVASRHIRASDENKIMLPIYFDFVRTIEGNFQFLIPNLQNTCPIL